MAATDEHVPVLIVGGGYAGLASALFLARQGVRALLVDRHPGVSIQGRARGINQRTMEIYEPFGVAGRIREAGRPFDSEAGVVRCRTLTGDWHWILDEDTPRDWPALTAGDFVMADQRSVEPILADQIRAEGGRILTDTHCVSVRAQPDHVVAVLHDRAGGDRRTVRAGYVIAADGTSSGVRDQAGIGRTGPGTTQHWVSIVIEADLEEIVSKRAMLWIVANDEVRLGSLLTTSVPGQWTVSLTYDPALEAPGDFTPARCQAVARAVIGAQVPVRVLDVAHWQEAVAVADRYRAGRILLVGDSAHVWPPTGAMGANAAVQDAHNLAWKLAGVVNGWAADSLLDSYQAERRPVAQALARLTVRRQQARFGRELGEEDVDDVLCTLGQRYTSAAVLDAAYDEVFADRLELTGWPGTRTPYLRLRLDGRPISVHDLFHDAFVLLTGPGGAGWLEAAAKASAHSGAPLRAYRVGPAAAGAELVDVDGAWPDRTGLGADGALLVRPDGYVAWRAPASGRPGAGGDPAARLGDALRQVLGTGS